MPKEEAERTKESEAENKGKHQRNGCGSEVGKDERKRGRELSKRNRTEGMGNQAGRKRKTGATKEAKEQRGSHWETEV